MHLIYIGPCNICAYCVLLAYPLITFPLLSNTMLR